MGQQCCAQVKVDGGLNTQQVQFNREIEEHLDKLEKDRIIEAQETSSQIGNTGGQMGSTIGYHDGKEVLNTSVTQMFQSQQQVLLNQSNEMSRQRSGEKQVSKKDIGYEDYEVRVIEAGSGIREHNSVLVSSNQQSQFSSQNSKDLVKSRSQERNNSSILKKQESIQKAAALITPAEEAHLEPTMKILTPYASNDESPNTSAQDDDEDRVLIQAAAAAAAAEKKKAKKPSLIQNNQSSQSMERQSSRDQQLAAMGGSQKNNPVPEYNNYMNTNNNGMSGGATINTDMMRENFANGGKKSILMNSLVKRDDPNSGSISLVSDDQQDKKRDRKVKLMTTPDKRFDTEQGGVGGGMDQMNGNDSPQYIKLKGVLKKYDPNASSFSNDSPRTQNKSKKKVKFKESTFKKQSKKKKCNPPSLLF